MEKATNVDNMASPSPAQGTPPAGNTFRAWLALVWFSWRRQARARYMVWIALCLLGLSLFLVVLWSIRDAWSVGAGRPRRSLVPNEQSLFVGAIELGAATRSPELIGLTQAVAAASSQVMREPQLPVIIFTQSVVFLMFLSFLLPLWSLSFATEAFGGERETRSLVWLLTRPLPRPAIYLAKFVALLPWSLGLNLGGFALLCLAAGAPGRQALSLYWPAVFWGTMAFAALFLLIGAAFRRPAVVSIVYSFFLETILGNMPGYMKRVSITFYVRCMMLKSLEQHIKAVGGEFRPPENPEVYLPVEYWTAWLVLMALTAVLLAAGLVIFQRSEYVAVE
jgi:ABC-2 type transport system permease protein